MSKRALLALDSPAVEALLSAALAAHDIAVSDVPPSAHLETQITLCAAADPEPPLCVIDLAVLAQLHTGVASFCAWRSARCPAARMVLMCADRHFIRPEERAWARSHGALDLLPGCHAQEWQQTLLPGLRVLLDALGIGSVDEPRTAAAMKSLPKSLRSAGAYPAAWARLAALRQIGIEPARFIEEMRGSDGPVVKDRVYHLKKYEECFVGSEAVEWIVRKTGVERERAVAIGQCLLDLGYLYHVVRGEPFRDGFYFYRFAAETERLATLDLTGLLSRFRSPGGVVIQDRKYHAVTYPACFTGEEAVAWLMGAEGLTHNEAMTLGQRLMDLHVFHHVTNEHPFQDGHFYYRFYEDEAGSIG